MSALSLLLFPHVSRGQTPGQYGAHGPETLFMSKPQAPGEAMVFTPAPLL